MVGTILYMDLLESSNTVVCHDLHELSWAISVHLAHIADKLLQNQLHALKSVRVAHYIIDDHWTASYIVSLSDNGTIRIRATCILHVYGLQMPSFDEM